MLPKRHRLSRRADFQIVWNRGAFVPTATIGAKIMPTANQPIRFGFSVGVKFSRKATERNSGRRALQEAIRPHLPTLQPGYSVILFFRRPHRETDFQDIPRAATQLLKKANLLK